MLECPARQSFRFSNMRISRSRLLCSNIIAALLLQSLMPGTAFGATAAAAETAPLTEKATVEASSPVDAGKDLTVEDVTVEGNRLVPTEDILNVVKTRRGDHFDREQVLNDLKAVNGMGYFDDRSLQVMPELSSTGGVLLKIRVQENAPVTQFAFQGNNVLSTEEISKLFADQLGKPQNLNQLSSAIDKVEQAYHERGYVLARITDVKDDPDGSISLEINEGTISQIQITGNKKTKDFIIKNAIKLKPGTVYNERQLTTDLRKLYGNGYFQDIRRSLSPSTDDPDKYVLKVEVDEKRTGSIGLGGGVDTVAGPFGSLSFSDANFRGRGQVLSFNSQLGSGMLGSVTNTLNNGGTQFLSNRPTYNVSADWIEPNLKGTNTSMAVSLFGKDFNSMMVSYAMQRTIGASVNFGHKLGHHWTANLGFTADTTKMSSVENLINGQNDISYLMSREIATGSATTLQGAAAAAGNLRSQMLTGGAYLSVSPHLTYDTRDRAIDPTRGTLVRLTSTPALGITNGSFMKLGASVSKYVSVGKDKTLAFGARGGTNLFGSMPYFSQYQLGGWNGMRGYKQFSALGTGSSMLMASAEYRFGLPFVPKDGMPGKIAKKVKGVFFVDGGGVGGNNSANSILQRSNLGAAVGVGLRVNMPMVGLIQLNYGFPLISSVLGHMTPQFSLGFGERF